MTVKKFLAFTVGLVISVFFLWLGFRNIPIQDIISGVTGINPLYIVPAIAIVITSFFIRALRWSILLSGKENLKNIFNIMMTGFMLNCIMPGRAGEVARPVIISRNRKIKFPEALSSIAVERLFDLLMLLFLFITFQPFIKIPEELSYKFGNYILNKELLMHIVSSMSKIGALLFLAILFLTMNFTQILISRIIASIDRFFSRTLSPKAYHYIRKYLISPFETFLNGAISGIKPVKSPRKFMIVTFFSFMVWFLQVVSYFLVLKSFPHIKINFAETAFVMIVVSFFIAIPSVPGFWGVWEAGGIFAMSIFYIPQSESAVFNLINHGVQMFPVIITGLISAWIIGFSFKKTADSSD